MELQIAAGKVLRRKEEWPVSSHDFRFAISFYGSVEVDDSSGVFQLWKQGTAGEDRESVPAE